MFFFKSILIFVAFFVHVHGYSDSKYYPKETWKIKEPASLGWNSSKLKKAETYFNNNGATALLVIDNGYMVAEWGASYGKVNVHSVRKSFLSALYGIYVNDGIIKLSNTLDQLGIDDKNGLTTQEKQAKISDLLKSRSGVFHPAAYETKSMKQRRPQRGSHLADTFYYYNNWDFNVLGTIFEKTTGQGIFESFYEKIAKPINMESFDASDGKYMRENVSVHPAYAFWMIARDMARFGLLFMRNGTWNNQEIISKNWINKSLTPYSQVGKGIGYGYMWWVSTGNWHLGNKVGAKAFSARGFWGQYIVILPKQNLVIVQVSDKQMGGKKVYGKKFNQQLKLILDAKD